MLSGLARLVSRQRVAEDADATDCSASDTGSEDSGVFDDALETIERGDEPPEEFEPANTRRASLDLSRGVRASLDRPLLPKPFEAGPSGTLADAHWADGDASLFRLRGVSYLSDRRKVAAGTAVCALAGLDLFAVPEPIRRISEHPRSWLQRHRRSGGRSFVLAVQFLNPGIDAKPRTSMSMYFTAAQGETLAELLNGAVAARPVAVNNGAPVADFSAGSTPFCAALRRFVAGDPVLKVIACVTGGPPLVRALLPRTPVLVAKNVPGTTVHVHENDIAVDIDITTCAWADRFFRHIFHRFAGVLVGDLAFVLEGRSEDCLPERLLGVAHIANVSPTLSVAWV
jgi:hypothetical protein